MSCDKALLTGFVLSTVKCHLTGLPRVGEFSGMLLIQHRVKECETYTVHCAGINIDRLLQLQLR